MNYSTSSLEFTDRNGKIKPNINGYQMLGDSQFLRFAEQLLKIPRKKQNGDAFRGLCFSGQRIEDLTKRVREEVYPISEKCVIMIGTNDILQNTSVEKMSEDIEELTLEVIKKGARKVVLLTIPPVPRLVDNHHWSTLKLFNEHVKSLHNGEDIIVVDAYAEFARRLPSSPPSSPTAETYDLFIDASQKFRTFPMKEILSYNYDSDALDPKNYEYNPYSDYTADIICVAYHSSTEGVIVEEIDLDLFEKYFDETNKEDLIHLNNQGLNVIKRLILAQDFL